MDAAFETNDYPGYTTFELMVCIKSHRDLPPDVLNRMVAEVCRRRRVAEGDVSAMTPGERLRFAKTGKA